MTTEMNNSDIAKHDVEIRELKRRMDKSEENDKSLDRLATIVEMQREDHKETKEYNRQITSVLQEMSTNIFGLNSEMKEMREDMSKVSNRVDGLEKEKVSRLQKNEERVIDLKWKIYAAVLTFLVLGVLGTWIVFK